jgi:hypothetical protein
MSYMTCHYNRIPAFNWAWARPLRGSAAVWRRSGDPALAGSPLGGVRPPLQHHYPLRAELDNGGLNVGPAWERKLIEKTGVNSYFWRRTDRRVVRGVSTQNEGSSRHLL